jgi:hypothetical protein
MRTTCPNELTTVAPAKRKERSRKHQKEVAVLIAGMGCVDICGERVETANETVHNVSNG